MPYRYEFYTPLGGAAPVEVFLDDLQRRDEAAFYRMAAIIRDRLLRPPREPGRRKLPPIRPVVDPVRAQGHTLYEMVDITVPERDMASILFFLPQAQGRADFILTNGYRKANLSTPDGRAVAAAVRAKTDWQQRFP